jgi:phage terminase large subunit-like protein
VSPEEKREHLALLEEKIRRRRRRKFFEWFPDSGPRKKALYPKHVEAINLSATKPYVMVFGGNGCITPWTRIETADGPRQIVECLGDDKLVVRSWDGESRCDALASGVFLKCIEPAFRIRLDSGQWFDCTRMHRVLTSEGWIEIGQLIRDASGLRYTRKARDFQGDFGQDDRQGDERLPSGQGIGLGSLPSAIDVLERSQLFVERADEEGRKRRYSHACQGDVRLPSYVYDPKQVADLCAQYVDPTDALDAQWCLQTCQELWQLTIESSQSRAKLEGQRGQCLRSGSDFLHDHDWYGDLGDWVFCPSEHVPLIGGNRIVAVIPLGFQPILDLTVEATECYESAGVFHHNTGKSELGAYWTAAHATGLYPDWWEGKRFDTATVGYAATETWTYVATRCQAKLLGTSTYEDLKNLAGDFGTGMIPADLILRIGPRIGSTEACAYVDVQHVSGGVSRIEFKSYEQGRSAFQGDNRHYGWFDEEDRTHGASFFAEVVQRFRGPCEGGVYLHTMTSLYGWTELATMFVYGMNPRVTREEYELSGRAYVAISQDDVPHMDADERERKLANAEPHLRASRRTGMPSMGTGAVYQVEEDFIRVPQRVIPAGWKHVWVMDPGYVDPTAVIWAAIDPGTGQIELYSEHYMTRGTPSDHAGAIKARDYDWRPFRKPGLIDTSAKRRDGRMTDDGEEATLLRELQGEHGLDVIPVTKTPIAEGCMQVLEALQTGRLKIQAHLQWWFSEYRLYRFDEKNQIVDKNNHLMDCTRYLLTGGGMARAKFKPSQVAEPTVRELIF